MKSIPLFLLLLAVPSLHAQGIEIIAGDPAVSEVHTPFSVDFDEAGHLYGVEFDDGNRVFKIEAKTGKFSFAGGKLSKTTSKDGDVSSGDGGPALEAAFSGMHDLAVTKAGDIYIADTWTFRVRKIDGKTGVVTTIAGTGKKGFSGDGGPAVKAETDGIFSVALSPDEKKLYLADMGNLRIREVNLESGLIRTVAGNGQKGVPKDGEPAVSQPLLNPRAIAVDPKDGRLYIVSRNGNALRVVEPDGRIRTVVNQSGEVGSAGDGGDALTATLNGPKHACVDWRGRVIIADAENHAIRRYDPATGKIERVAGTPGQRGATITGETTLLARPHGVRVSRDGKWLYIADSYNNRVLRLPYDGAPVAE